MNNEGQVVVTSGDDSTLNLDPSTETPSFLIRNWKALPLKAVNTSVQPQTPIRIQLIGQGLAGTTPVDIPTNNSALNLASGACAKALVPPRRIRLSLVASSGDRSTVAVIGGPRDSYGNNAYVFGINFEANTEWNTQYPPPAGYYQTTTTNTILYQFNWPYGGLLFCANLSSALANMNQPLTAAVVQI